MPDIFDSILKSAQNLAAGVSEILSDPELLQYTSEILERGQYKDVLDYLAKRSSGESKTVALLAIASDCLSWVYNAIVADGEVEAEEVERGYLVLRPFANYYASSLSNRYARFAELPEQQAGDFLVAYIKDEEWFGGAQGNSTLYMGADLCYALSYLDDNVSALDEYENMVVQIIVSIVASDGVNESERKLIRQVRELVQVRRDAVLASISNRERAKASSHQTPPKRQEPSREPEKQGNETKVPERERVVPPEEALAQASSELEALIGLSEVKAEVRRLMNFLKIQQERKKHGLRETTQALHFVFTGNPGTGKTTVARILSKILYGFGLLKTPKLVECDRSSLVASYVGQTANKTEEKIQAALDGVLFIDEAYTLYKEAHGTTDFGQEAIDQLLKGMEDHRDRLVVIAAGYPDKMEQFISMNPGLESRFTRKITFEDYSSQELCRIFDKYCRENEYSLTVDACIRAFLLFALSFARRNERFGNARFVRTTYEKAVAFHSDRLATLGENLDKASLSTLDAPDVPLSPNDAKQLPLALFAESKWESECPGCGKVARAGMKFLGQRVSCKCGQVFFFPWWSLILESSPGIPPELLLPSRQSDRLGVLPREPKPKRGHVQGGNTESRSGTERSASAWRPDASLGFNLLTRGLEYLRKSNPRKAIECFEEAIRADWPNTNPSKRPYYLHRAEAYQETGELGAVTALEEYNSAIGLCRRSVFQAAIQAYHRSIAADPNFLWAGNNLAWLLVTCRQEHFRDPREAVQIANQVCDQSEWHCWSFIDTLAAAEAELGDFLGAVKHVDMAIAVAPDEEIPDLRSKVGLYRKKIPLSQSH